MRISPPGVDPDDIFEVHSFYCPFRQQRVQAQFRRSRSLARPEAVTWCSAFTPPTAVVCATRCLELELFSWPASMPR